MIILLAFLLYTILVFIACYKFEAIRYRLCFAYILGVMIAALLSFYIDMGVAAAVSIFVGLATMAKMCTHLG